MRDEILELLIQTLAKITKKDAGSLNEETSIKEDLRLKSIELANITAVMEDEYDAYIKFTDLMHAKTIGEMADVVVRTLDA